MLFPIYHLSLSVSRGMEQQYICIFIMVTVLAYSITPLQTHTHRLPQPKSLASYFHWHTQTFHFAKKKRPTPDWAPTPAADGVVCIFGISILMRLRFFHLNPTPQISKCLKNHSKATANGRTNRTPKAKRTGFQSFPISEPTPNPPEHVYACSNVIALRRWANTHMTHTTHDTHTPVAFCFLWFLVGRDLWFFFRSACVWVRLSERVHY